MSVLGSALDAREKIVTRTPQATDYLAAQRWAAEPIERRLRRELGPEAFGALERLLVALSPGEDVPLRDYIQAHRSDVDRPA